MAKAPKRRKINLTQYEKQLAEQVNAPDNLVEIDINAEESVTITVPIGMDQDKLDDFQERLKAAAAIGPDEMALVILSGHPTKTAEEQLAAWKATGRSVDLLATVFMTESNEARERLGNFRYGA